MIISDLSHLELLTEDIAILGRAGTVVNASGRASGAVSTTDVQTRAFAIKLPNGGSVAIGFGIAKAKASDPVDASANTYADGEAQGDFTLELGKTKSYDNGPKAGSISYVVVVGIDRPH